MKNNSSRPSISQDPSSVRRFGWLKICVVLGMIGTCGVSLLTAEEAPASSGKVPVNGNVAVAEKDSDSASQTVAERMKAIFPGITIHAQERYVDVDASICLTEGFLELVACTKDSKEHESIVVIAAKAKHIHAALLLLGAHPGNPAMRKPANKERTRWVDLPPAGDPIKVSLVMKDKEGKETEHSISEFITNVKVSENASSEEPAEHKKVADHAVFPDTFVFAGSAFQGEGGEADQYLCDQSGNVISIATFGDELLCLAGIHTQDNAELDWWINTKTIPELGTKVTLRLRPVKAAPTEKK